MMKQLQYGVAAMALALVPGAAMAQSSDGAVEPYVGVSAGYHDLGLGIPGDNGGIYGGVAGADFPVNGPIFIGVEGNYHFGDGAIDNEYGIAGRIGYKIGDNSKVYVRGGYQEVEFDLVHILGGDPPPGADDSDGDYLVGIGTDIGFGTSPLRFRLAADTISFDSTRLTAGVLYSF